MDICPLSRGNVRVFSDLWTRLKPKGPLFRDIAMHNTKDMGRVLYRHDWTDLQEWATALVELGDLSDDEIAELVADQDATPPYVS